MSILGNLVWILFGGLWSALGYWISGIGLCLTIVGIPFGLQAFKFGWAILAPFGLEVVSDHDDSFLELVFNIIWLIFFGWEIALSHLLWGCLMAITIVGMPFAVQHFKLIPLSLFPFGKRLER